MSFLSDVDLRPVALTESPGLEPVGLALGNGSQAIEVVVTRAGRAPAQGAMRTAWRSRVGGRATPVLMVSLHDGKASICGPAGENPPAFLRQDQEQVEKICRVALSEPDRHSALRFLQSALDGLGTPLPAVRNEGLFASHALQQWGMTPRDSASKGKTALPSRGRQLMTALGYQVQPLAGPVSLLLAGPRRMAVAAFLDRGESPDVDSTRFSDVSPASYALSRAGDEGLDWVIIAAGSMLRLYAVKPGVGVGRRGRTETFVELQLDLLADTQATYLWDLFSAEALAPDGALQDLLADSDRYGSDLGIRLRDRIYVHAVPKLSIALAQARNFVSPTQHDLAETYQMALTVLFRILFVAYAEDRDLLPYKSNGLYQVRSLKEKAKELARLAEQQVPFDTSSSHWEETRGIFRAIDKGSTEWGVPAYNGGLFSEDPVVSPAGAALAELSLSNSEFGPVLRAVLVDEDGDRFVPVDFRSLGVRAFGTIYEGLLESELSVADTDLDVDERSSYVPTKIPEPAVRKGDIYLHNRSGARKSTGSYFTKSFAVEHLLEHSLEPALDDHIARVDALSDDDAGDAFFDFRVADIAMGSGHFLVAALDRIERRYTDYLAKRPLAEVRQELDRLRNTAEKTMGTSLGSAEIEDTQLLRRQIARRCIYGVDLNPLAVELARLSLWVHTFVPGLPLSLLDHHLVGGNSLVGIGTLDEARELVEAAAGGPLFSQLAEDLMSQAAEAVRRVGRLADADAAEVERAREALRKAKETESPLEAMLDILAASRLDPGIGVDAGTLTDWQSQPEAIQGSTLHTRARDALREIPPFHFPVAFPDVFQRDRPGFDVIIGNPPWEKAQIEEHGFWARYFPGLRGTNQREREERMPSLRAERPDLQKLFEAETHSADFLRQVLMTGPYPGMGRGHPDLYKAFCWRFWHLSARPNGRVGVVLPRAVWSIKGSELFRNAVLHLGRVEDLTFLVNNLQWIFEEVHPQYTIALTTLSTTAPDQDATIPLRGPYRSLERFRQGTRQEPVRSPVSQALEWTDTAALPLLPTEDSAQVFAQLRKAPRLDLNDGSSWRARPLQGDLNATNDKHLMAFVPEQPVGYWPVFKGESFDIWEPDRGQGSYYAWIDPEPLKEHLLDKRRRSAGRKGSPFGEFASDWLKDPRTLSPLHPRIAFRDVSRATDTRTVRVALVPPKVVLQHTAPYLLFTRGDARDEASLLGVLSSIPLDWYARRFVETHLTFFVLNPFPFPRPSRSDVLWQRTTVLAGRLACPDDRFADWAEAVGVECGPLSAGEKQDMIDELDAVVAHLYGLSEPQLGHIFETFHEGWDYSPRMEATLKHFHAWRGKL